MLFFIWDHGHIFQEVLLDKCAIKRTSESMEFSCNNFSLAEMNEMYTEDMTPC